MTKIKEKDKLKKIQRENMKQNRSRALQCRKSILILLILEFGLHAEFQGPKTQRI